MSRIALFYEEINFVLPQQTKTKAWLKTVIKQEDFRLEHINFIFCSDAYLHKLNKDYLDHDTLTDIITFDYTEENLLEGDIYISIDRVGENARQINTPFEQELKRVMVHGLLHMMGYTDKTDDQRQQMRNKEDSSLSLYQLE